MIFFLNFFIEKYEIIPFIISVISDTLSPDPLWE